MKNLKFPLLGILFFGIFMMSCSKEEPISFKIENATDIMAKFNTGLHGFQKGEVIYGEVYMRSTDDHQLLVFVKNADFDKETLVYKLQTKKLQNPLFKEIIDKAQVFYFKNQLIVNDIDSSRRFSLRLSDANNHLKSDEEGSLINGFGLARMIINLESENNNTILREDENNLQSSAGEPGASEPVGTLGCICLNNGNTTFSCNSGGPGSTGCGGNYGPSGAFCIVNCSAGTYSCCYSE